MTTTEQQPFSMIAKTVSGLEEILARELESLGATDIEILKRAVGFKGNKSLLYKSNLWCRTALHILKPVHAFPFNDETEYYHKMLTFQWEDYLDIHQTFAIDAVSTQSVFTHSHYLAQRTKDAIADRFRGKYGIRPSVNISDPDVRINIHIFRNQCNVSLDSSGGSLHKRGYRVQTGPAPLNEVLAAGLVLLSGWNKSIALLDPMCGSGTILIEAALIAHNIPPGSFRKEFGFEKWKDFDPTQWEEIKSQSTSKWIPFNKEIRGSDKSHDMIRIASKNIANTGLEKTIRLQIHDFMEPPQSLSEGFIITNPPYGERLKEEDLNNFYKSIGDTLKKNYSGYEAWIFSADKNMLKHLGLKPSKKITLYNGPIECKFINFALYRGSLKSKYLSDRHSSDS